MTISSFSPGIGKHFIGNALCCNSFTFCTLSQYDVLYKLPEKIQRSQYWGTMDPGNGSPIFLYNNQEVPVHKGMTMTEELG
jgi:hypothetical protein